MPILFLHGDNDQIVPPKHSEELYERANKPKKRIILKGTGHNDSDIEVIAKEIATFLN